MKLKGITDVFFDLDHTLWDFDKNSALTFDKIFKINNVNIAVKDFLEHYEPINLNYWKLYREEKIQKDTLRYGRLNDTFEAVGFKVDTGLINKLSDDYITHLSSFNHLFENTFEILEYLSLNYTLHIITNGFDEVQYKKMSHSKINHYFKTITNSEIAGVKKPNPKIFNYALNLANTNASKSVMIGDSYEADIMGAKNIGMDVVFFDINNLEVDSKIKQIDNLIQLKKYL
ncbi:noncanonical pyrimidine nucleotidase, YjjG family [Algibacter amylolyticus]|uniref:Noncanonical pyrimidine nucleotidase, YjjG family n=1 Tax=Algibacter amylolyticus TaxID=1608400 RepID=A0A5M7BFJ8_9FLAO|nr:YjjG family noncanonical pyrimidine nucleotidase [Algibacter amylolyticus]KAA5828132.1 noncanonical pyrimidine nucleotidase, YjjG family [Algibacter amylolyticus]MBB5267381.1 putative hydrolase of the HAD superfamily [Algibacter amylolyticus]TSJ82377.1 noncanonical pyrimidine nucleotidase, YjjG family [Algibacter amylolyticus]